MSAHNERSVSSSSSPPPAVPSPSISITGRGNANAHVNVGTAGTLNQQASSHRQTSKRPASPTDGNDARAKRQKDTSSAQNRAPAMSQSLADPRDQGTIGTAYVIMAPELRRVLALPSSKVNPLPRPWSVSLNRLISQELAPAPGAIKDNNMIIRIIQSGVIQDLGYTMADINPLTTWLVKELTSKLNLLFDQDEHMHCNADGQLPALLKSINAKGRMSGDMKALAKWVKEDYVKPIAFPDIEAYRNRLVPIAYKTPKSIDIYDMLELIVEVEQRVKGLPVSNSQLWSPPQFDVQTPSSAQGVAVVRDNSVRAPLQPRPGQQTATPNGSMMVPPAPNAQSPMVQASPRQEFLVHQDPRVSSGSATPSALPQSGVLREKTYLPVSAPPQFRVASSKLALPHTNPRGPSNPESPNQTQAPTDPSASMQSFSPAAGPAMASFHNGFIQKDPSLD